MATTYLIRNLKQTLTYWGNPVPDGYGGYDFDAPVAIDGRWAEKMELFIDVNGREIRSQVVAYLAQDVNEGGYLALGTYTDGSYDDPMAVDGAYPIKAFRKTPNIRATAWERKAWL